MDRPAHSCARSEMMLSVTRRVARAAGVCESVLPPSTARWTRTLILPTAGASGSMVGDPICRPTARPHPESAAVAPEFAVPEHRWAEEGDAATPDGPFALMAVPKRKVTPSRRKRRNQFKRIDFVTDVQRCRDCGKAKRPHVYCDQCSTNIYDDLKVGAGPAPGECRAVDEARCVGDVSGRDGRGREALVGPRVPKHEVRIYKTDARA